MNPRSTFRIPHLLLALSLSACAHKPSAPPAAEALPSATAIDPVEATPEYWYDKPATAHVPARDYYRLFSACQAAAREFLFKVDRADYREGLVTTYPVTGAQFFEFWRPDNSTLHDVAESSLGTIRRTIRIEIDSLPDGTYLATPKVLIERETLLGRRITAAVKFRDAFTADTGGAPPITSQGIPLPYTYWYATGRDHPLERRIADAILEHLD
jgi:hypothetical protein